MHVVIVGAGFSGLSAAFELQNLGHSVTVLEAEGHVGGLAGGFEGPAGSTLERFYHHWFSTDTDITQLIDELGLSERIVARQSKTGLYYRRSIFNLSTPLDVLRFTALSPWDRIRLGVLVLRAKATRDWHKLESLTARDWLIGLCGTNVYEVVWEPLLRGKFGTYAEKISAVWIWSKLCLRGSSRNRRGDESLLYFRGGFAALAESLRETIVRRGGSVLTDTMVQRIEAAGRHVVGMDTARGFIAADAAIITTALPVAADLTQGALSASERASMNRVKYLANICLILRLSQSLSSLYWLNVNDTSFPFVGVIEHTNFEPSESYDGEHIVYLSRYLPDSDPLYRLSDEDYAEYALGYLSKMFPDFNRSWIIAFHVWRADYAQPVVEREHSKIVPPVTTSLTNLYVCTMAQVYPEDRGTNYAVRNGRAVARIVGANVPPRELTS